MTPAEAIPAPATPHETHWRWAASPSAMWTLIAVVTLARIIYLAFFCPYTLTEDEAFYWDWSRHLDLSYYSKGPGIAWLIAAGVRTFGHSEFAVRIGAALSAALLSAAVGLWAKGIFTITSGNADQGRRAGFYAAVSTLLLPMFQASALLMTIDGPYAACWALSCLFAHHALFRNRPWMWPLAGVSLGLAFLFKYTAIVLPLSWLIAFLFSRSLRRAAPLRILPLLVALLAFAICISPIIIWNAREGWPTLAHLLGHLGLKGGDVAPTQGAGAWHYSPLWTLSYILGQFALAGPVFALGILAAVRFAHSHPAARFAVWSGAPLLALYLLVSFLTEPEGNWAFAAHISSCVLAGGLVESAMTTWRHKLLHWRTLPTPRPRQGFLFARPATGIQVLWHTSLIVGTLVALGILGLPTIDVAWKAITGAPKSPIPVGRFTNADAMALHAAELASQLTPDPFFCAMHYGRAAQLAFYLPSHPHVVCASSTLAGGRRTQYDYWPETRLDFPILQGRSAIVVGGTRSDWLPLFQSIGEPITLNGDTKRGRPAFQATGFHFIPPSP